MPDKDNFGALLQPVSHALTQSQRGTTEDGTGRGTPIVIDRAAFNQGQNAQYTMCIEESDSMPSLVSKGPHAIAHAFKIRGGSETETGEQGGTPGRKAGKGYLGSDETAFTVASSQDQHVAVSEVYPINTMAVQGRPSDNGKMTFGIGTPDDPCPTLQKAHSHAVAYETHGVDLYNQELTDDVHCPLRTAGGHGAPAVLNQAMAFEPGSIARNAGPSDLSEVSPTLRREMGDNEPATLSAMAVRRLTPVECERLQGFPDGWTQIPWRKKPAEDCPDGPRYKAIGNSMAVNVMQWIGLRIAMFEELKELELVPNYTDTYWVK